MRPIEVEGAWREQRYNTIQMRGSRQPQIAMPPAQLLAAKVARNHPLDRSVPHFAFCHPLLHRSPMLAEIQCHPALNESLVPIMVLSGEAQIYLSDLCPCMVQTTFWKMRRPDQFIISRHQRQCEYMDMTIVVWSRLPTGQR